MLVLAIRDKIRRCTIRDVYEQDRQIHCSSTSTVHERTSVLDFTRFTWFVYWILPFSRAIDYELFVNRREFPRTTNNRMNRTQYTHCSRIWMNREQRNTILCYRHIHTTIQYVMQYNSQHIYVIYRVYFYVRGAYFNSYRTIKIELQHNEKKNVFLYLFLLISYFEKYKPLYTFYNKFWFYFFFFFLRFWKSNRLFRFAIFRFWARNLLILKLRVFCWLSFCASLRGSLTYRWWLLVANRLIVDAFSGSFFENYFTFFYSFKKPKKNGFRLNRFLICLIFKWRMIVKTWILLHVLYILSVGFISNLYLKTKFCIYIIILFKTLLY